MDDRITITEGAVEAIRSQLDRRGTPEASLRLGVRGGGCSGFSYVVEFHDGPPREGDLVFDSTASDGSRVRVVCDARSMLYLSGSTFDWENTLMKQGFKFKNPNERSSCGCGSSFDV